MPASTPRRLRAQAVTMLLFANLFWGLSFPVIKAVLLLEGRLIPDASPWFYTLYAVAPRFVAAFAVMALVRACRRRFDVRRSEIVQGVVVGLFAVGGMILQNDGLQYTAASTSAFLTQAYAVTIPLWIAMRSRRNPGWATWASCALVVGGVAVLGRFDWRLLRLGRGEWETLVSSLFFMGQILWIGDRRFAGNRQAVMTLVMFGTEAALLSVLAICAAPSAGALAAPLSSGPWIGLTVILAVFPTLGSFTIMNAWQPVITATEAGLIYCVEPIFGSFMALFLPALFALWAGITYPNEVMTSGLLLGGGLITLANILIQLEPPRS